MSFLLAIDPLDTLAIRDGRPFNQDDAGRAATASLFPPPPETCYGAARVACARSHGWSGAGAWGEEVEKVGLGSWDVPGNFAISGPHFRDESGDDLLPIPSHVYARVCRKSGAVISVFTLSPGPETLQTDVGLTRLFDPPPYDVNLRDVPLAGRWGRRSAILELLDGQGVDPVALGKPVQTAWRETPQDGLPGWGLDDLSASEVRIGLERDLANRRAKDGMLYAAIRRLLRPNIEMFVKVCGIDWGKTPVPPVAFGGEGRAASFYKICAASTLPQTEPKGRYTICLMTPGAFAPPKPGEGFVGFKGAVIAASVTDVGTRAGFSRGSRKGAGQAHPFIPAGSIFFMDETEKATATATDPAALRRFGYGEILIGRWTDG